MSSTTIEKEIVQMVFEAKEFRKGIRESIEDLAEFKKSFEFNNAQTGLAELQSSSNIDFSTMAEGISSINSKMSLMGVAAAAVIANIATSILGVGKSLADALIITPLSTGLEEYETQLNAIQTILANTKKHGTTLEDVSGALDELNSYADLTIYNFTQMTDSIGKFTTAGVDLDTSVTAIKGIANIAAVSGSSANQASTAMYQLSQAISSGVVRLQDWISVENAGMGGQAFKDSLMETAAVHGVAIDTIIEQEGGFRNSLQKGWLSSEILLDTLAKFTGDLTDEQLKVMGYTEDQIVAIQEMAVTANDAATKIKTLSQLKDTLAEAMQSGWSQTWAIIFGDFEEAKEFWGQVGTFFGDMIADSSDARNDLLSFWKIMGGRTKLIEGFFNILEAATNILGAFGSAIQDVFRPLRGVDLLAITDAFLAFSEKLKMASESTATFKRIIRGFAAAFDIVRLVLFALLKPLAALIPGLQAGGEGFFSWLANLGDIVFAFRNFAAETEFFDGVMASIFEHVRAFRDEAQKLVDAFYELEVVKDVVAWLEGLGRSDLVAFWQGLLTVVTAIAAPIYLLALAAKALYEEIVKLEVVQQIVEHFKSISWESIKESFEGLSDSINEIIENVKKSDLVGKFVEYLNTFDGRRLTQFLTDAKENFSGLGSLIGGITGRLGGLESRAAGVGEALKDIGRALLEGLKSVLDYLIENADDIDYSRLFDIINTGLLAGLVLSIRRLGDSLNIGDALEGIFGEDSSLGDSISDMFGTLTSTISTFQTNIKADTLQKIAISIALLAGSIILLTLIDSEKLDKATKTMVVMVATLFGGAGALSLIKTQDAIKASLAIIGLSTALAIASFALKNVADLDQDEIKSGLLAMAAGLTALVVSVNAISSGTGPGLLKTVGILIGLGIALLVLSAAISVFGEMDPDVLSQGLTAIAISLALLVASMSILSTGKGTSTLKASAAIIGMAFALDKLADSVVKFGEMDVDVLTQGLKSAGIALGGFAAFSRLVRPAGMIAASIGITIMSVALVIMAEAVERFADISWEELIRGLAGMAGALLILVIAATAMSGAIGGAIATIIMSGAILLLVTALKSLAELSWPQLILALIGLAAVFVILGLAGLILTPVIPTLLLLSLAMLLIGAAGALLGLGLLAAATGLVAIAGAAALIAKGIVLVGEAVIDTLPELVVALVVTLANFLKTLAQNMPSIIQSMRTIILGMIQAVTALIPDMVEAIFQMLVAILVRVSDSMPDLVQAGWEILIAFMKGLNDHMPEMVQTILEMIVVILFHIADSMPQLVQAGWEILLAFIKGIADNIQDMVDEIMTTVTTILNTIALRIPDVVQAGYDILLAIIKGVSDNIAEVVANALYVIAQFIDGIAQGLPDIVDSAFNLLLTFLEAIEDAIEEYMPRFIQAGVNIGKAIVKGLVQGIKSGIGAVKRAVLKLAKAAWNRLVSFFDAKSPSRLTYKLAEFVIKGFVNGIKDGIKEVVEGMEEFGRRAKEGLDPMIQTLNEDIDKGVEFRPVITPVLDLNEITTGVKTLNKSFNNAKVLAALSYEGQITIEGEEFGVGINGSSGRVTFIQNNYSPKALDRETIYRQTRTQVAKLSQRAFE